MSEFKEINVVFEKFKILSDENGNTLTGEQLESITECSALTSYAMLHESLECYQQHLKESPFNELMHHKLMLAYRLKQKFPDKKVTFTNTNDFYNIATDSMGLAAIEQNFTLSDYAFQNCNKEVNIMFDYYGTGLWSDHGSTDLDMVAMSDATKNLINQFQSGLNNMRIPYDDDFTQEEEKEAHSYMDLGLQGAIALKKELPDWKVTFYNYGSYYDLPILEWNCSEITLDMDFENIKRNIDVKNS